MGKLVSRNSPFWSKRIVVLPKTKNEDKSLIDLSNLDKVEREDLISTLEQTAKLKDEWLRRQIIDNNRIDILAEQVLGYTIKPFHLKMMQFQFKHPHTLQLAFRGAGKSCSPETRVIKYDGSIVRVDSLKVGDQLMGPDSTPRTVVQTQPGYGPMYEIRPTRGKPWRCNGDHILTLKGTGHREGEIWDVNLLEYLERFKSSEKGLLDSPWRQFRAPVEGTDIDKNHLIERFEVEPVGDGPYFGILLDGDGRFLLEDFTVTHNSTACTITKAIHLLIKDRNLRILLVSRTKSNAENFLKEIRTHFESNKRLVELFGTFYDPYLVGKWTDSEIEIVGRTKNYREGSVSCASVDSAIVSRHFDVILSDDLVDEENARTKNQREKTKVWMYQTLDPTLEPPDPKIPHRGEHHIVGTRYHYDDIYGHFMENELKSSYHIVPALDENDQSPWPEKYPAKWFIEKRKKAGTIVFSAQYLCQTDAMKGEVFRYDDCQQIDPKNYPENLKVFMGIDLAIKQSESADQFAIVVLGIEGKLGTDDVNIYVLDAYASHLRFSQQTSKIIKMYKKWDPIRGLVEANAYQLAQYQTLEEVLPGNRIEPHITTKDKISRAWKLSALFEQGRVFFKKNTMGPLIDQLVLFPNHRFKDLFDAFDLAFLASRTIKRKRKKRERAEPGIIGIKRG